MKRAEEPGCRSRRVARIRLRLRCLPGLLKPGPRNPHAEAGGIPGGSTSSRDTQTLSVAELKVAYAEVRSGKGKPPVTISAARLPANAAGYDLIVVETIAVATIG